MRFAVAIAVSFAVHLLVGLGIWLYLEYAPAPDVLVTLDLSSVELSFADAVDDTAAVLPQTPVTKSVKPEVAKPPMTEVPPPLSPMPEIPDAVDIPKPMVRPDVSAPATEAPAVPAPRQARVDAPPRPTRTIRPDYPKGARQRGEQGDVLVELTVDASGAVSNAKVVASSGFAELDEAALRAVRSAKFTPAKSGRDSVASTARITLTFKLK